jgi:putative redox protein
MPYLTVSHRGHHRFEVNVEGHHLIVDEGMAAGGRDSGPTPTELLAASLASCVAAYAESYLSSRGYATAGLSISCHYQLSADYPRRVSSLDVTVTAPVELGIDHRRSLMRAVEQCMVGNTLRMPPQIQFLLVAPEESPVG